MNEIILGRSKNMSNMIFNIKGEIRFILDANKNLLTEIIQIENELNIFPEEILKIKLRPYGRNAKRFRKARIREAGACA